ncbi:MAG: DUF5522 domain-containing protein [Meiothermus sp.]|nr:DUF5522 domain-containing protein [Meiothermus sp.]
MPRLELKENVDYYMENDLYVFTGAYHLKRGYCCGSRCRHCPYAKPIQDEAVRRRLAGRPFTAEEFAATYGKTPVQSGS